MNTGYAQHDTIMENNSDTSDFVTLITTFHKSKATKDGYYVEDYIVDMSAKEARRLDGKKIKITGQVNIIKGLKNESPEYDTDGKRVIMQGREEDTKYIVSPVIEILKE